MLRNLESNLAGLVEGTFSRAFKSEVRPVEIARKLAREMDEHKVQSLSRVYAPNEYAVWLSPKDRAQFDGYESDLASELSGYLLEPDGSENEPFYRRHRIMLDGNNGNNGWALRVYDRGSNEKKWEISGLQLYNPTGALNYRVAQARGSLLLLHLGLSVACFDLAEKKRLWEYPIFGEHSRIDMNNIQVQAGPDEELIMTLDAQAGTKITIGRTTVLESNYVAIVTRDGLAALDPARAVRPTRADTGHESGAPPVVVTRRDEPTHAADAPEVAAEMDRSGLAVRPDSEIQRPVAPGADIAKPKPWLWIAAAVLLGVVLAVAGAAILMRQKPQDLAIKPPVEAQQLAPPQPSAKIAERVEPPPPASPAPAAPASGPQTGQSTAPGAAPATPAPDAANPPASPSAGRAAMLVAAADNPQKPVVSLGSTTWSLIPPAPNQPATVAVKAEADIPDLKMHATMTLRKNTDPTLQATHTIDLKFSFAEGAPITGFKDVGLPQMRKEDSTAAEALTSVKVKISDTYFLIALAKGDSDTARNLDLMQTRAWFDFPLLLNDDRIAKIVFQKSPEGQAMLDKAFEAWK